MRIIKALFDKLNNAIPIEPPETGGILGSTDGEVIDYFIPDLPSDTGLHYCSYKPNVRYFNAKIAEWQERSIQFMGIYHTHFANVKTLSSADRTYIEQIMLAMPQGVGWLYFPIFTLPERVLTPYIALKCDKSVTIDNDELIIL